MLCIAVATVPLFSILFEVVRNGIGAISCQFLISPPGVFGQAGGGIANAIQGTIILLALASAIAVPFGLLSGVYLAEFGDNGYGRTVRFLNDVLSEFPSIVIGILVYSIIVLAMGGFSATAGAIALSIIMLPLLTRPREKSIKLAPSTVRAAGFVLSFR